MNKLFPYQLTGAQWLADKKYALLADRPRLGKTVQAIAACDLVHAREKDPLKFAVHENRILVVCRAVAKEQWAKEFLKWQKIERPVKVLDKKGCYGDKNFGGFKNLTPTGVFIISYEMFTQKFEHMDLNKIFHICIIDESHYLKNHKAIRTKKILGKNGLLHHTERMWLLTGTPMPNHAGELWTMLYALGITKMDYEKFAHHFCNYFESVYGTQITGTRTDKCRVEELRELLAQLMLRRTEEEVSIELPEIITGTNTIKPSLVDITAAGLFTEQIKEIGIDGVKEKLKTEMGLYNTIINNTASHQLLEVLKATANSLSTLRRYTALQKVKGVAEMITEEIYDGAYNKVVIFAIHRQAIELLASELKQFHPAVLFGGTTCNASEIISRFQNPESRCKVFIGNITAAGTSISLSAANHIYFLEEAWTPGDNAQAMMRCGGVNQKGKTIFVTKILLDNSVDEKVSATIDRKIREQKLVYDGPRRDSLASLI